MINELLRLITTLYLIGGASNLADCGLAFNLGEMREEREKSPLKGDYEVAILIPALHEESVICGTIKNVGNLQTGPSINYGATVITHPDDPKTFETAKDCIAEMGFDHVEVISEDYSPKTKPSALNAAYRHLKEQGRLPDIIGILDAENRYSSPDILVDVCRVFDEPKVGAVQIRIIPISDSKGKFWQHTAAVEFSSLYSLPEDRGRSRNPFKWGKMSIRDKFTQPFLGGICFFRSAALEALTKVNIRDKPRGVPFDPYGLTEDFTSTLELIDQGWKVVYLPKVGVYASFPDSLIGRINQESRWFTGKIQSIWEKPVTSLNVPLRKKLEIIREEFFSVVPPVNLIALVYLGWDILHSLGLQVPRPPTGTQPFMLTTLAYGILSTIDSVYKTCTMYGKRIFSKEALEFLTASLANQWIVQPLGALKAYKNITSSALTGKPVEWNKTPHRELDGFSVEGMVKNDYHTESEGMGEDNRLLEKSGMHRKRM